MTLSEESKYCEDLLNDDERILKKQTADLQLQKNESAKTLIGVFY